MAVINPVINPVMSPVVYNPTVKDSRWLTLDVCREYTRNKCTRTEDECRFAHPPPNVEVQNGRVMCCFDSIKGKCQRHDPPCKYLHPPQHLKEQLLQNGRHNLILKHLQMQVLMNGMHNIYPVMYDVNGGTAKSFTTSNCYAVAPIPGQETFMTHHYLVPNGTAFNPYYGPPYGAVPGMIPTLNTCGASVPISHQPMTGDSNQLVPVSHPSPVMEQQSVEQIEAVEQDNGNSNNNVATISMSTSSFLPCHSVSQCQPQVWQGSTPPSPSVFAVDSTGSAASFCQPVFFQGGNMEPGMAPVLKRGAIVGNKYGLPMYQAPPPPALAYQQMALAAMHLQQQPMYVPITIAGHPPPISPRY